MPVEFFLLAQVTGNPSFQSVLCAPSVNVIPFRKKIRTKLPNLYDPGFGKLDIKLV
jgi:hypothetical protein